MWYWRMAVAFLAGWVGGVDLNSDLLGQFAGQVLDLAQAEQGGGDHDHAQGEGSSRVQAVAFRVIAVAEIDEHAKDGGLTS